MRTNNEQMSRFLESEMDSLIFEVKGMLPYRVFKLSGINIY